MDRPQHLECDTPDCTFWKDGDCTKETSVTIQEHHCADFEERIEPPPAATVTIEINGGALQNVYASPDLPEINVELIDFDVFKDASDAERNRAQRMLDEIKAHHKQIY